MLGHYLLTALRNIACNKVASSINIVCLSVGLLCLLAVYAAVAYLQHSDARFPNAERTFALTQKTYSPGSHAAMATVPSSAWAAAQYLKLDFPELEQVARLTTPEDASLAGGSTKITARIRYADANIFDIFPLPLIDGRVATALRSPHSIVVSRAVALRLFGDVRNVVGRTIALSAQTSVIVTGVIGDIPQPSHLSTETSANPFQRFDALVSMDVYESANEGSSALTSWTAPFTTTYVVLPRNGSLSSAAMRDRLREFGKRRVATGEWVCEFDLVPVSEIALSYLNAIVGTDKTGISATAVIYLLGGLVLIIACVNYANLAAALASSRAREVGMRRTVGANRFDIAAQSFVEAAFSTVVASLIASGVLVVGLSLFGKSVGDFGVAAILASARFWLILCSLLGVVTVAAGSYPAFVLATLRPIQVVTHGRDRHAARFAPKLLVVLQFAGAGFLITALLVVVAQTERAKAAAFASLSNPIVVVFNDAADPKTTFDGVRSRLRDDPHIRAVTAAENAPWGMHAGIASISGSPDPAAARKPVTVYGVYDDFFSALDFVVLAGRVFDRERAEDTGAVDAGSTVANIIVDRSFAEQYGWERPQDALNRIVYLRKRQADGNTPRALRIIGVVENRPMTLVGFGATSAIYRYLPDAPKALLIIINRNAVPQALAAIDAAWNHVNPQLAVNRKFADELLARAFWLFSLVNVFLTLASVAAISVAVLGIVGMSLHVLSRRKYEIGVRKTLGASVSRISALLLSDFSRPVLLANLLAWPAALVVMRAYLSIFIHPVGLTLAPFFESLALCLCIAWLAVLAQVLRAARGQPATVLRYE